ncbi:hypothetical protein ABB30_01645 [Stenotrophomonas ginsengisoli]|uniref:Uncharacterized protein n=1 Tax=Stenotrophomonas ginsengisoli TaxID=336566 RepID=A0A0R0DA45_9GAMM|nr:hypothetical protein ABB30_01645 [Stenotrophomonas ginsengisoli]
MRSLFVVIDHPPVGGFAYIVETGVEISVENFFTEGAIEAFDEGVLIVFAWLDVLQSYPIGLEPAGEYFPQKFRPVVRPYNLRQAMGTL